VKKFRYPREGSRWWHMGIEIPYALPWHATETEDSWDTWRAKMLVKYPIKYRIYRTIEDFRYWLFDSQFSWHELTKWWILHRFHPKHRYHVLKPRTLKPGYLSPRDMILHAAMESLVSYMEHEGSRVCWLCDWNHAKTYYQMVRIRNWWQNIYPTREIDWSDDSLNHFEIEKQHDLEENKMLKELVDIRLYLW
jgi:hypothetical protein